jgi:hypothetical protein
MKRIVVHIDRLVLSGFRNEDRHAVSAGLREELGRVLANRDSVSRLIALGRVPRMQVGGVQIAQSTKPLRSGESIAHGIEPKK